MAKAGVALPVNTQGGKLALYYVGEWSLEPYIFIETLSFLH